MAPKCWITLDEAASKLIYHPGESVRGTIFTQIDLPSDLVSVKVYFTGMVKTKAGDVDRRCCQLFKDAETIFLGKEAMTPRSNGIASKSWPFHFTMPNDVRNGAHLPPSWSRDPTGGMKNITAKIRYKLRAEVLFESQPTNRSTPSQWLATGKCRINLRPMRRLDPFVESICSLRKCEFELKDRRLHQSFTSSASVPVSRSRRGNLWKTISTVPTLGVSMKVLLPAVHVIGSGFDVRVSLHYDAAKSHDLVDDDEFRPTGDSPFELRKVTAGIYSMTKINGKEVRDIVAVQEESLSETMRYDEQRTIFGKLNKLVPRGDALVPSFDVGMVARDYTAELVVTVGAHGKEWNYQCSGSLIVLPEAVEGLPPRYAQEGAGDDDFVHELPPPSYQEATSGRFSRCVSPSQEGREPSSRISSSTVYRG